MPKAIAKSPAIELIDDAEPTPREIQFVLDSSSGQPLVEGRLYVGGVHRATFIRVKLASGQKIAADFPGCDSTYVVVDGSGHITNG